MNRGGEPGMMVKEVNSLLGKRQVMDDFMPMN